MDFLVNNWPLVLLACVSGGMLLGQSAGLRGGASVGTAEAVRLMNREKGVLIDVSEPAEYNQGHPAGAKNVPLASIANGKDLPTNKALPVILTCATGARSSRAVALLKKAGYAQAVALAGGTKAWREANLPTASNKA